MNSKGVLAHPTCTSSEAPTSGGSRTERKGNPVGRGPKIRRLPAFWEFQWINLPNHFILAHYMTRLSGEGTVQKGQAGILFYINPYSQGTVIGPDDAFEFWSHYRR